MKVLLLLCALLCLVTLCLSDDGSTNALPPSRIRICNSQGDPHITRFDGIIYDFQQIGDHVYTYFAGTVVQGRHVTCGFGVACNKGVAVGTADSNFLQIIDDTWLLNGGTYAITLGVTNYVSPLLSFIKYGYEDYRIFVTGGYVVWQWGTITIYITDPSIPLPAIGLCSVTPRCVTVSTHGQVPIKTPLQIAATWRVVDALESAFIYTSVEPFDVINKVGVPENYGPFTTTDQNIIQLYTQACAPLTGDAVARCAQIVPPDPYHKSCTDDVIAFGKADNARGTITSYNAICAAYQGTTTAT